MSDRRSVPHPGISRTTNWPRRRDILSSPQRMLHVASSAEMENIPPQTGYNTVISFQQANGNLFRSNVPSVVFMNLQHQNYQKRRITVRWMLNKAVILMRVAVSTKSYGESVDTPELLFPRYSKRSTNIIRYAQVQCMSQLGGTSEGELLRNILSRNIHGDYANRINVSGLDGRRALKSTRLYKCIKMAVKPIPAFSSATEISMN
ncbi:hypothetical protein EG68_08675 [Paragonimus skrjabini miyazakii]|uniref:Uncharacterized protein n=1 Tax=Paragonimus skrjabini miyazakii TaxID=59628 RepID=A0A8S9YFY9_9TREM|nr:hypothetical protein EG68_08675 [Paragonimus skrjabini miyazakii]